MDTKEKKNKYSLLKLVKRTELLLLLLVLPMFFSGGKAVKGSYIVAGVESKVSLYYGDEFYEFSTYKTELLDAVVSQGFKIYEQDIFSIPRATRLNGGEVEVNVVRSLPVVINDEGEHIIGRTVYSKPEKILEQNNIKFWPQDKLSIELITDPMSQGGVGQLVTVKRAPVYKIAVDGKVKEVHTWDNLVENIILESATKLNPNDIVKPSLKELVANGTKITITRIEYAEVTERKVIPYSTVYSGTTALSLGETRVSTSGANGQKKNTYKITYKNGEEVSRTLISSVVTKYKQDAVVLRGAVTGKCKWGKLYETRDGPYTTAFHYALAHHDPSLKGRYILVTNLANGKSIKVKIVDAGPTDGLLDLSTTAIIAIGGMNDINILGYIPNVMVELL